MIRRNIMALIMLFGITACHASTTIQLGRYLTFTPAPVRHGLNQWVVYPVKNGHNLFQTVNAVLQPIGYRLLTEKSVSHHVYYLYRKKLPHYLLRKRKITIKIFLMKAAGYRYQLAVDKAHHLVSYVVRPDIYVTKKKSFLDRIVAFTRGKT